MEFAISSRTKSGKWKKNKLVDGRPTWRNVKMTQYYRKTREKLEIEVYNHKGEHIGVIKPSDGVLRKDLAVAGRHINVR